MDYKSINIRITKDLLKEVLKIWMRANLSDFELEMAMVHPLTIPAIGQLITDFLTGNKMLLESPKAKKLLILFKEYKMIPIDFELEDLKESQGDFLVDLHHSEFSDLKPLKRHLNRRNQKTIVENDPRVSYEVALEGISRPFEN